MANYNKTQMYFFKFPNTFFDKDEIEELLSDFDGANTVILYLRLITLATNKEGYLGKIIAGELKPYSLEELSYVMSQVNVGDTLKLEIYRSSTGQVQTINVTLKQ